MVQKKLHFKFENFLNWPEIWSFWIHWSINKMTSLWVNKYFSCIHIALTYLPSFVSYNSSIFQQSGRYPYTSICPIYQTWLITSRDSSSLSVTQSIVSHLLLDRVLFRHSSVIFPLAAVNEWQVRSAFSNQ